MISQTDITPNKDLKVVSVPNEMDLDSFPMPRRQIENPIAAGKLEGQHHPRYSNLNELNPFRFKSLHFSRLDYLFMDGSSLCYNTLFYLLKKIIRERRETLDFNLFSSISSSSSSLSTPEALWQWV